MDFVAELLKHAIVPLHVETNKESNVISSTTFVVAHNIYIDHVQLIRNLITFFKRPIYFFLYIHMFMQ